tara:strand:- start:1330 stop:2214 length:885 start_codon:yes stop_codon:yes gene_type:complete
VEKLKSKSLTPGELGLGGWSGTRKELIKAIPYDRMPSIAAKIFKSIIDTGSYLPEHKSFINLGTNNKALFADGGEILLPIIITKKRPHSIISFPSAGNEKIYDFYIDGEGYSAKLNQGATTSSNQKIINDYIDASSPSPYRSAIRAMNSRKTNEGRIEAHKILNLPGYKFKNASDLKRTLSNLTFDQFMKKFPVFVKYAKRCKKAFTKQNYNNLEIRPNFIYWPLAKMLDEAFVGAGNRLMTEAIRQIPGQYAHLNVKDMTANIIPFVARKYKLCHHQGLKVTLRNRAPFKQII